MSALPPKADIGTQPRDVCFVPKEDKVHRSKMVLCDHLVGADDERLRNCQPKRFRCLEIKNQLEFCSMSALPPKADIGTQPPNVRFVPKADISQLHSIT